ncbi:MAG: hypothetical protein K2F63_02545 [Muribaculaceae bacterium]|nr:hypothetical protein [Muribaculaceae bacterium]MDE6134883.1 hypothetical protein [Muribaculaceae bacterium]
MAKCHGPATCRDGDSIEEIAESVGNDGDIKITLLWDFPGDVDLHVVQPNGTELYYSNMRDPSTGGELDVDNRSGGRGSAENIYWLNPPEGRYNVAVVMYSINEAAPYGGLAKVVVKANGNTSTYTVNLSREGQRERVNSFYYGSDR